MFSSGELIEALRRRRRRSLRPERPAGEFPEGWGAWFASMRAGAGAVTGVSPDSILAIFLAREPRLPPEALAGLGRWQAFTSLWRQEWHPASCDERGVRIFATIVSLVLHILFSIVLVWLMYARFMGVAPADAMRGDDVVQVEFIGDGTPEEQGGDPPQGETPLADASAAAPPAPSEALPQPVSSALPEPAVANRETPAPEMTAPPVAQPLQVTETPDPDTRFVLPPPRPVDIAGPRVAVPELQTRPREIIVVEMPQVRPLEHALPQRDIAVPDLQQRPLEVTAREIPAPLPQIHVRPLSQPSIATPELSAPTLRVTAREVPMPAATSTSPSTTAGTRAASSTTAGTATASQASTPGGQPDRAGGARSEAAAAGSGLAATPSPGAAPSARRAEGWGDSTRNRPGGQADGGTPGLFNPDGSPRLAGDDGRAGGGLPPGTITEDYEKIDRMGTWLKRPPIGYEPTSLDRFWVPHENLLQEWVRRSIKEVLIPIPGTRKTIRCAIALLALGGACGITDPNLVDIEADARKAPDVPFKPELQEDQDALRDPAATP